ncbi:MAG: YitT family protein [Desulfobacterales bacterium]|nr:YitT family protein [Desulfobacterales bacterium]MDH3828520.1 YitT family protein [Desulfobacterales bacterium]
MLPKKFTLKKILTILWNLLLIFAGSVLCAIAIKGILVPKEFLAGGVTGLALLGHYVFPSLPIGFIYFLLNIPLFVIGWMFVGRRFFWYSLAGMIIFSAVIFWPSPVFSVEDMILNALAAGVITGLGSGIILRSLGSAGGLDILSIILFKRFSVRPGTTVMTFHAILLFIALFRLPMERVLYTLIYFFINAYFVNLVVIGLSQRKAIMIISSRWKDISRQIMEQLQRGVTIVQGEGGYSGQRLHILYSVITLTELSRFKVLVRKIDPNAFVVVTETLEVMGKRIGNQPRW